MKKGLFAILAILTVFAMVMTSCDTGGGDVTWDVTFDANGGTFSGGATTKVVSVKDGATVSAPSPAPTKTADATYRYTLEDWYTEQTTTTKYNFAAKVTAEITLYAKWTQVDANSVIVTLNGNGGTVSPASLVVNKTSGTLSDLSTVTATRSGYTFDKWTQNADGSGTVYTSTSTGFTDDITIYAQWTAGSEPPEGPKPIPVEEISLANAWFAIYEITLPSGKKWSDYDAKLTVDYKFDETNLLGSEARAVRLMGNYLPVEVANPRLGKYTDGGTTSYVATVGNWPSGTSNEWIMATLASWGNAGETPEKLSPWTYPEAEADINADEWFTIWYPVTGAALAGGTAGPDVNWNKSGIGRLPGANDAGPFYFGVGVPGGNSNANTFQMTNVTLLGKEGTANAVGRPLYYTKDGQKFRALAGNMQDPGDDGLNTNMNGGNPGWRIISGEDGIVTKAAPTTEETVTISFDANGGSAVTTTVTVRKGEMVTHAQLNPTSTKAGNKLEGWFTEASGGVKVSAATYFKICTENATFYAQWTPLPNATEDVSIVAEGAVVQSGFKVSSFGGLGALNDNAGLGPFVFNSSKDASTGQQYDAAIWFAYPADINTAIYDKIQIVVTLSDQTGDTSLPMKLVFQNGRPVNSWSGGEASYKELSSLGDLDVELDVLSTGIMIQHNRNNDESSGFSLTIKSITLVAPTD